MLSQHPGQNERNRHNSQSGNSKRAPVECSIQRSSFNILSSEHPTRSASTNPTLTHLHKILPIVTTVKHTRMERLSRQVRYVQHTAVGVHVLYCAHSASFYLTYAFRIAFTFVYCSSHLMLYSDSHSSTESKTVLYSPMTHLMKSGYIFTSNVL